eukprot:504963-Prymnesium_polylepis.1
MSARCLSTQGEICLKAAAPPEELVQALCHLLPLPPDGDEPADSLRAAALAGRAVRAVALACAGLEATLLCEMGSEAALRERLGPLSSRGALLLDVRLSRCALARELRGRMESLADEFEAAVAGGEPDGG